MAVAIRQHKHLHAAPTRTSMKRLLATVTLVLKFVSAASQVCVHVCWWWRMKATHTDESYTYRLSHTHYLRKRGGRRKREGESVYLLHTLLWGWLSVTDGRGGCRGWGQFFSWNQKINLFHHLSFFYCIFFSPVLLASVTRSLALWFYWYHRPLFSEFSNGNKKKNSAKKNIPARKINK